MPEATGQPSPPQQVSPAPTSRARWWGCVPVLTLLILAPALLYSANPDTALFLLVGDVIARGGRPYLDVWELKSPAVYLVYAVPALLGGDLATAWVWARVMDVGLAAGTATALAMLARRLLNDTAAIAAAIWYIVLYAAGGYQVMGQAETWANLLLPLFLILLWDGTLPGTQRKHGWLLMGLLLAVLAAFKPTAIVPAITAGTVLLWQRRRELPLGKKSGLVRVALFFLGVATPTLFLAVWLKSIGALDAYAEIQRDFLAPYLRSARAEPLEAVKFFLIAFAVLSFTFWLPALLCLLGVINRTVWRPGAKALAVALIAGGVLSMWLQSRAFPYHFQVYLPGVVLLAGAGTAVIFARIPHALTCAVLVPLVWHGVTQINTYALAVGALTTPSNADRWFVHHVQSERKRNLEGLLQAVEHIRKTSGPQDKLVVFGHEAELNILANRRSATRFFHNPALVVPYAPQRWKNQFITQVNEERPRFIALIKDDDLSWLGIQPRPGRAGNTPADHVWPELQHLLERDYAVDLENAHLRLLRRRDGQ